MPHCLRWPGKQNDATAQEAQAQYSMVTPNDHTKIQQVTHEKITKIANTRIAFSGRYLAVIRSILFPQQRPGGAIIRDKRARD